jgi:hypothetical protein
LEFIRRRGQVLAQGPGIAVTQWIERQNEVLYAVYSFSIWDVFSVYAAATPSHKPIREMLTALIHLQGRDSLADVA